MNSLTKVITNIFHCIKIQSKFIIYISNDNPVDFCAFSGLHSHNIVTLIWPSWLTGRKEPIIYLSHNVVHLYIWKTSVNYIYLTRIFEWKLLWMMVSYFCIQLQYWLQYSSECVFLRKISWPHAHCTLFLWCTMYWDFDTAVRLCPMLLFTWSYWVTLLVLLY